MKLKKYDNKYVRITDIEDICYEGLCYYNDKEYNECEYGRNDDSLDILNIKFYNSCIKKVKILDNLSNNEYGNLEKLIIDDDIDFIEDALDTEDKIHIDRLILCIKDNINSFKDKDKIRKLLNKYEDKL